MTGVNSLESVLKWLGTIGRSYEDPSYEPTFKSSAMFPIMCGGELAVSLSFMNYWRYKNNIEQVSCLITLRSQRGNLLKRTYFKVEEDVYTFKFPDLVDEFLDSHGTFVGSCELEFHSIEDLKYHYPAVSIFYETPDGVSAVHMASRVFHSTSDMDLRLMSDVQETGFDIYSDDTLTPFLCFTNGPRPVKDATVTFKSFNHLGEEEAIDTRLGELNPYETVFHFPDEHFELKEFLNDKVGFCKVKYDSFGIFPRLVCGNIRRDRSRFAITHSYYDVSQREEYFPVNTSGDTRGSFRAIPILPGQQIDVDLNFYPIFSPGELYLKARIYGIDGELLAHMDDLGTIKSPSNRMVSLRIRDMMRTAEIPVDNVSLVSIECAPGNESMPTRINCGVNYHKQGQIGTNINISMHRDLEFNSLKPSHKWLPVFTRDDLRNYVLISALSHRVGDDFETDVKLDIFSKTGKIHSQIVPIKNQTSKILGIEDALSSVGYEVEKGEILWCTLESDCGYIDAYYLTLSNQGFIGGDHSF